jgi:hypothetical protein
MFIFVIANLPLPLIIYLNLRVTWRFIRVRKLSRNTPVEKPLRFYVGWVMSNLAIIFVLIPPLTEHRFFVQDPRWLICYGISAALTIGGLLLMNNALGQELTQLADARRSKVEPKPVDMAGPDTL